MVVGRLGGQSADGDTDPRLTKRPVSAAPAATLRVAATPDDGVRHIDVYTYSSDEDI